MRFLAAVLLCAASAGVASASQEFFCRAANDGNLEAVKKSIRDGADIDYRCPTSIGKETALFMASQNGHTEVVRWLLEAGADANTVDHQGASPLYMAAQKNHDDVVRLLLAEVDPRDTILKSNGASPLHVAADLGSIATLETLLDDGRLPVDGLSLEGHTPLHQAAHQGQLKAIELLLRHGADASIAYDGETPADIASRRGHDEVVALLTEAERKAAATKTFCPSLFAGNVEAVELAIRNGVDVDYRCPAQEGNGTQTALYDSSRYGDVDMIRLLLDKGAAVNSPDGYSSFPGSTALHAAAGYGQTDVVELLLRRGGNASQVDASGWNPLHQASKWGHLEVVEMLLADGSVDINSRDAQGETAIYRAARNGHAEVVRLLVARGGDANLPEAQGVHPIYVAAEKNRSDVVRVLLEVVDPRRATWKGFSPLHVAADTGSTASLEVLLEDGRLSVNDRSANGATPLYYAAQYGGRGTVGMLLRYGADPSLAQNEGFTPLYVAAQRNHGDIVRLLLDVVDPHQSIRSNGWSPLHTAALDDAKAALETLLEAKLDEPLGRAESKAEPVPEGYEKLARALEHLGESHLLPIFEAEQIDDAALPTVDPTDLISLGVSETTCETILGAIIAAPKVLVDEETYDATAARAAELETSLTAHQAEVQRLKKILKEQQREIPDAYLCPITMDPMEDPCIAADGHSYERRAITDWFARGNNTSPKTGAQLDDTRLFPNHALKSAIQDFLEEVRRFDAATAGARD